MKLSQGGTRCALIRVKPGTGKVGDPPTFRQDRSSTSRSAASDRVTGFPFIDEADSAATAI
jgi:hypothetical protein